MPGAARVGRSFAPPDYELTLLRARELGSQDAAPSPLCQGGAVLKPLCTPHAIT